MFLLLFLGAILLFTYYYITVIYNYWSKRGVPHVKPVPLAGNIYHVLLQTKALPQVLNDLYNKFPDARYFGFHQFFEPILVIKDRELIKRICIKDFEHFTDHKPFFSENIDPLVGKNLFSLKGQYWRDMRITLSPAFTGSKLRGMFVLMKDCADQFVHYHLERTKKEKSGVLVVDMKDSSSRFCCDVIASTAFGLKCDSLTERDNLFYRYGNETSLSGFIKTLKLFGFCTFPLLMKMLKITLYSAELRTFYRNLVLDTMALREKTGTVRTDMINILMLAKKGNLKHDNIPTQTGDSGFAAVEDFVSTLSQNRRVNWSDDYLIAQVIVFLLAGFDTVSFMISFMSHELAVNVDCQRRLQEEIDATLDRCDGNVTYDILAKMKYLDMVACETLRKWPPGFLLDRVCVKPYTIQPIHPDEKPIHLDKGNLLWIPVYPIHHDPMLYPDPEKFDPERFSPENVDVIKPCTYMPFGVGPRNCIGSRMALMQAKMFIVSVLTHFDIVVVEKTQVPLKLSRNQISMDAEGGFWVGFRARVK